MKLLNRIGLQLMLLAVFSCTLGPEISGVMELRGLSKEKVYLLQPEKLTDVAGSYLCKIIDSATFGPRFGDFHFYNIPKSDSLQLFILAVQPSGKQANYLETSNPLEANYMPFIWDSKNSLNITSNWNSFQASFSINDPGEENKKLLELRDLKRKSYLEFIAEKYWNTGVGSELLSREKAEFNYQKSLIDFAENTNQFLPAMVALRWVSPENDYERVPEVLVDQCKKWQKTMPDHPWTKQLCAMGNPDKLPVLKGDAFPNLELPLISGDTATVKNLLGKKVTIIDLWASWCAPCRKENREFLVPLWDSYHDKGLNIVAYGLESDAKYWKEATENDGANRWYQASDLQGDDGDFLKSIRVTTIPANFILDAEGKVLAKNLHGQDLNTFIENYFK